MSAESSFGTVIATAQARILLVSSDVGIATTLAERLTQEGYLMETAWNGDESFAQAVSDSPDLILLDIMVRGKSGLEICRDLRQQGVSSPILMLTAHRGPIESVLALKCGADDCLDKEFDTLEMLARVEALLRRTRQPVCTSSSRLQFGDIRLDPRRAELIRDDEQIPLSGKELSLISYFLDHRGEVLSRDELLHEVWGYKAVTSSRTLDVHVAWLRQKIEHDTKQPHWITTVRGIGYRFAPDRKS